MDRLLLYLRRERCFMPSLFALSGFEKDEGLSENGRSSSFEGPFGLEKGLLIGGDVRGAKPRVPRSRRIPSEFQPADALNSNRSPSSSDSKDLVQLTRV
ncbi:Hypothetical protein NTJ_09823 [Nesidiocoris tenuis]|uniref:Uncharacterized protein n=1 Tax=Nesidiocoris tenuis TaxID=355587 RepID=A0ABN7AXU9_9HEMI|nr:Hypothetical protein NTJ_09823 [Nesidiocoris tenuis]